MGIRGESVINEFTGNRANQFEHAEAIIRKYWGHTTFHSLDGDSEILDFAKKNAQKIDKLERIANYFDEDMAVSCREGSSVDATTNLWRNRFSIYEKTSVLTKDSARMILDDIDEKTAGCIVCLPSKTLAKFLLIAHNEGLNKAEEIRGDGGLKDYQAEYLRVYDFSDVERKTKPQFSEVINGTGRSPA